MERGSSPVVCAWCAATIRSGEGPVSHGMCDLCVASFEREVLALMAPQPGHRRRMASARRDRRRVRAAGGTLQLPLPFLDQFALAAG